MAGRVTGFLLCFGHDVFWYLQAKLPVWSPPFLPPDVKEA